MVVESRDSSPASSPRTVEPRWSNSGQLEFVHPSSARTRSQSTAPVQAVHRELTKHPVVLRGRHRPGAQIAFSLHSSPRSPAWKTQRPQTSPDQSSSGRVFKLARSIPSAPSSAMTERKAPKPPGYRPNTARAFQSTLMKPDRPRTTAGVVRTGMHEFYARMDEGVKELESAPLNHQVRWYRDCARGDTGTVGEKPGVGTGWWPAVTSTHLISAALPSRLYDPLIVPRAPPARQKPAPKSVRQQAAVCPQLAVCRHCSQVHPEGLGGRWHAEACPGLAFKGNRFDWYPNQSKYSTHEFHQDQVSLIR